MKKMILVISLTLMFTSTSSLEVDIAARVQKLHEVSRMQYVNSVLQDIEEQAGVIIPVYATIDHIVYMYEVAQQFELPIRIVFRMINQESLFRQDALSHKGAYGYTQLMPGTYEQYHRLLFGEAFIDDHSPYKNIYIGLFYLRELYDTWGCWMLALASYNAGPGKVRRYQGIPPYRETRNYVRIIYQT